LTLIESLGRAIKDVEAAGATYAIVGGLAVGIRTEPRFTRHADIAVAVDADEETEQLVHRLISAGYSVDASLEHANGRLATVRLLPPTEGEAGVIVDLIFASSGIETEVVAEATNEIIAQGIEGRVAAIPHLIAMKTVSESERRFQDRADLVGLIRASQPAEIARAFELVDLATARGYNRERDLRASLEGFIAVAAQTD